MINVNIEREQNTVFVSPEGSLGVDDFEKMSEMISTYINESDKVPALLIMSKAIPHWDSFAALVKHVQLVKNFQKVIPKVAIVSDSEVLSVVPGLIDHFVGAKIRHFSIAHLEQAKQWAMAEGDHPGEFELIEDLPRNVIGLNIKGIITSQDYEQVLTPLIEAKLAEHEKINVLVVISNDFQSYSAGALWDDAKLGLMHFRGFNKVALVTDLCWMRVASKFFGPLVPAQLHVFTLAEMQQAREWVVA